MVTEKGNRKKNVVFVAMPNTMLINLAGPVDVFTHANLFIEQKYGIKEGYNIHVVSPDSSKIIKGRSGVGFYITGKYHEIKQKIDTLLIPGFSSAYNWKNKSAFIKWLQKKASKTRRICSVCRGAFLLAEAGLLKGKNATTHWKLCNDLQKQYPDIHVDSDPIFVKDRNTYTSAGVSSGIDLALALVEEDYGKDVALNVAREMVLYLRRPGTQSQFSRLLDQQEADTEPIKELQNWLQNNLHKSLTVEQLAERCSMSTRNFSRIFLKELGLTPGKYLEKLRVEAARRLLEESSFSLEKVAIECGLGSSDSMRRLFLRHLKTNPADYRKSFRTAFNFSRANWA